MTATIRLRETQLLKYMGMSNLDTKRDLARRMNVNESTVSRVLLGHTAPGEQFIAALLKAFPHLDFYDLFEVVDKAA